CKGIPFLLMVPVGFHLWPAPERAQFFVPCRFIGLYGNMYHGLIIPKGLSEPIRGLGKTAHVNHAASGSAPGPGWPFFPEVTTGAYISNACFTYVIKPRPK